MFSYLVRVSPAHPPHGDRRRTKSKSRDVVTLFLSDHGQRRSKTAKTSALDPAGIDDSDRPMLILIVPDSVRQALGSEEWAKIETVATSTVVSAFDVPSTLVHIANIMSGNSGGNSSVAAGMTGSVDSVDHGPDPPKVAPTNLSSCFMGPASRQGTSLLSLPFERTCMQAGVPTEWCIDGGAPWRNMSLSQVSTLSELFVRAGTAASHGLEPQVCEAWVLAQTPASNLSCAAWTVSIDGYAVAKVRIQIQYRVLFSAVFVSEQKVVHQCMSQNKGNTETCDPLQSAGNWRGPLHMDRVTTYGDCNCNSRSAQRALCMCQQCSAFRREKALTEADIKCDGGVSSR